MVYYCHPHTSYTLSVHGYIHGTMYSCICMLSQYKTYILLEVEVCFGSNQDANNFIMIVLTGNNQSSASTLYKQSQGEEQNEQVNTNKHHILDQLSILCVHQCTESGVHQLPVVNSRCSLYKLECSVKHKPRALNTPTSSEGLTCIVFTNTALVHGIQILFLV